MYKQMPLKAKLALGFGIVLLFLVLVSGLSILRFVSIRDISQTMTLDTENRIYAIQKQVDHLEWVQGLGTLFLDDHVNSVHVETDPRLCSLGRWIYGGELQELAASNPELATLVEHLKVPHEALHSSALAIDETYEYFDNEVNDQLANAWIAHLHWIAELSTSISTGQVFTGELDPSNCSFGRWLSTYSGVDEAITELLSLWEEPHELLHSAAVDIVDAQVRGDYGTAAAIYSATVLPLLSQLEIAREAAVEHFSALSDAQQSARELYDDETLPALENTRSALDQVVEYFQNRSESAIANMEQTISAVMMLLVALSISAVVLAIFMAALTTTSVMNQLGADPAILDAVAQKVGQGDLDIEFTKKSTEKGVCRSVYQMVTSLGEKVGQLQEIGEGNLGVQVNLSSQKDGLGLAMMQMKTSMSQILREMQTASHQVSSASNQIANASQMLSEGATQQAASLEEVSASVMEISSRSQQNADNAKEANGIAGRSAGDARDGNQQMQELVEAMAAITESSKEIQRVVKVIDDIAFQTNLLALNANVEAARSGKYGKGFAVVADEVRNLANRSAQAVGETAEMVESALKNIKKGDALVQATAGQLKAIVEGSDQVSVLLMEISHASVEQSEALREISNTLGEIDTVTQSNTASAEQSSAAAEELTSQASLLDQMARRFRLDDGADAQASSAGPQVYLPGRGENFPDITGNMHAR